MSAIGSTPFHRNANHTDLYQTSSLNCFAGRRDFKAGGWPETSNFSNYTDYCNSTGTFKRIFGDYTS